MTTITRQCTTVALLGILAGSVGSQGIAWTELLTKTKPAARRFHAMAYDSARDRVVVFGGRIGGSSLDFGDTWEFDGTDWMDVTPKTSPNPARRHGAGMTYDPIRKRCVLFGGRPETNTDFSDTWEWDGKTWVQMKPQTHPSARRAPSMFFDPKLGKIVLFGGRYQRLTNYADTWTWDGMIWVKLSPTNSPPARMGAPAEYNALRKRAVLFGGWSGSERKDTWEWDSSTWTEVTTTRGPDERNDATIVGPTDLGLAILFGGFGLDRRVRGDTWFFDGRNWTELLLRKSPPARNAHRAVYDSKRSRILVFGGDAPLSGLFNDLWSLESLRAAFRSFGKGCASTTALPTVSSTDKPALGQDFTLNIKGFLRRPQAGQLLLGASDKIWGNIPLPLPLVVLNMPNCSLWVSIDLIHPIATDQHGNLQTTFKVPADTSILGAVLVGQAIAPDRKANALGLATTNAFKAVVGF